mmetsp:Transcript_13196/g.24199  ORF Transcript_13196/g.24199 Transcript_13196/m.24199 type:complete len:320 (-) Transcript_13196:7717-8676(-)
MVLGCSSSAILLSLTLSSSSSKSLLRASSKLFRSPTPLLLTCFTSRSLFSFCFCANSFSFSALSMSLRACSAPPMAASSSAVFSSSLLSNTSILLSNFLSPSAPPPVLLLDSGSLTTAFLPLLLGLVSSSFFVSSLSLCPAAALLRAKFCEVRTIILFSSSATLALSSLLDLESSPLRSFNFAPALLSFPTASSFSLLASSRPSLAFLTSPSNSAISSACLSFSALTLFRALSLFSLLALASARACFAPAISSMRLLSWLLMSCTSSLRRSLALPSASCLPWRAAMSLAALASSLSMKACLSLTTACLKFVIFVSLLRN